MKKIVECLNITIKGIVQGVGFRPFIFNLARDMGLKGYVTNTSDGVFIAVEGEDLTAFTEKIRTEAPPLSCIMSIELSPREFCGFGDFSIRKSSDSGNFTLISQDISVCPDCLRELFDPHDRRYLYPFINCTNCGPRYTITKSIPYDRVNTTMQAFRMCKDCENEYNDPKDRRFHAQPNACHVCGPQIQFKDSRSSLRFDEKTFPVESAIRLLKQGSIIAIKGLGGFHLACDAFNRDAVEFLRKRKRKSNKPFALMAPDLETIKKMCEVSEYEETLLLSPSRPIVLLQKKRDVFLPEAVAPNNKYLGIMLPYTPLHYLLFEFPLSGSSAPHFSALVMTSGNISEEPIVIDNEDAVDRLSVIADAFLLHNRDIAERADDSVVRDASLSLIQESRASVFRVSQKRPIISFVRRSRGYVPLPIPLESEGPDVLGCGADLKNTFTITRGKYAISSQHIGDMENYETLRFFEETLGNLSSVYRAVPVAIAHDLHPGYLTTQWALKEGDRKREEGKIIPVYGVQHHYAHIVSVMAEKGITEKVIGVSFDGNGYGDDGTLWGSEFLIADLAGYKRAGHFNYVPLPGGEMAIREPWRTAVSYVKEAVGDEVWTYLQASGMTQRFSEETLRKIIQISDKGEFSPRSTAAGRLFDAVSALMGLCDRNTFEGEAATALESLVAEGVNDDYPLDISFDTVMQVDFSHAILRIIDDIRRGVEPAVISTRFHNTVASAIIRVVGKLSLVHNLNKVVLSGGVFQNLYLMKRVSGGLRDACLQVFVNEVVPCNDAGISLGQAYIARERIRCGVYGT